MSYSLFLLPLVILAAAYLEVYKVDHVTVAYVADNCRMRGYTFDYARNRKDNWLSITDFEHYVAAKKGLPQVKILGMQIKTQWKIRRALEENKSNIKVSSLIYKFYKKG
jgi:hypothetical protein